MNAEDVDKAYSLPLFLNPVGGRPSLPGIAIESATAATVAANGGLSTWRFKGFQPREYISV